MEKTRKTFHRLYLLSSGDPDSLLNDNQLLEMAQNRHRWRLWLNALQPKDDDEVDESQPTNFWQLFSEGVKLK